ncbi:MAG: hypothetical protein JSR37_00395 [Verrucomicrobia bacterium]|nr:hypothetical protein [Verrucomicrobiota bacterium]
MTGIQISLNPNFDWDKWIDFVEEAANQNRPELKRHICRVIYPLRIFELDLMSQSDVNSFFNTYGRWRANCVKMPFREIIAISRRCLAIWDNNVYTDQKVRLTKALNQMADKAEAKYASGWQGTVRKVISWISNLFSSSTVRLFNQDDSSIELRLPPSAKPLPTFVGTDATYARLVARAYTAPAS